MSNETPAPLDLIYRLALKLRTHSQENADNFTYLTAGKILDHIKDVRALPPGEGKEGAGPAVDWEQVLWEASVEAKFNSRMSLHYLHTFAKAIRKALAAGPRPSSSQPLAPVCGFCNGTRKVDSGGQDGAGQWIEVECSHCRPSPESLGGRLIVQSPDAEDQK